MKTVENQIAIYKNYEGKYHGNKIARVFNFLVGRFLTDNILDIGAGDGSLINALRKKGFKNVVGIDLEPKNESVIKGDASNLKFKSAEFDIVVLTEVIEHLNNEQIPKVLNEIFRVLHKNGKLIVTTPYKENFEQNMVCCPNCKNKFHRYGHEQLFNSESELVKLFAENKFKIIWMKPYSIGPMAAFKILRYFNFIFKKLTHLESFSQTMFVVCQKI